MLLAGLRVLEWSDRLAGVFCGRILADLGAEVIKLEPEDGDPLRAAEPRLPGGEGALFAYANHGKRSLLLDPASPRAAPMLRRLLDTSQLLVTSQGWDGLAPLGLAPPGPYAANPALSVLCVTAFGADAAAVPAHTDLTLTHHAGYAYHQARPVQRPAAQPPIGGADREGPLATGVAAAAAALWALLEAERTGRGVYADCAQADVMAHLLIEPLADYNRGERSFGRRRDDLRGTEIAGGLVWMLPCADGLVMVSPREQHQWDRWVALLGHPAWASEAGLCDTREARTTHWARLQEEMSAWTRQHTREAVAQAAQAAKVACFPVSTPRDLLENAQLRARGFLDTVGGVAMPGLPFTLQTAGGGTLPRPRAAQAPGEADAEWARHAG